MQNTWDQIWLNANLVTCSNNAYNLIENGAIATQKNKIAWVGAMQDLPKGYKAKKKHDCEGRWLTPGLIDCHTHTVFGGNRAHEFKMKLSGMRYEEIAKAGGGIVSTVQATRAASYEQLLAQSTQRVQQMLAQGVTTLEIKSGYGLDVDTEIKILKVARAIGETLPVHVQTTFLGAHALPPEFTDKDKYIDCVIEEMLPKIAAENLADAVDVFCEKIAFDLAQTERVFEAARKYNLAIKCHAEQLSDMKSAELAAQYSALSVDHLEYLSPQSILEMKKNNTVAVLLPGAFYFLQEKKTPPVEMLRKNQIPMAIASDCNPGTSPTTSLLLMLNMACVKFKLTPEEAFMGITTHAAKALGFGDSKGCLSVGYDADFALWDVQHIDELAYYFGFNPCVGRVLAGAVVS